MWHLQPAVPRPMVAGIAVPDNAGEGECIEEIEAGGPCWPTAFRASPAGGGTQLRRFPQSDLSEKF